MNTKQSELLNTQLSVEEITNKNSTLVEIEDIPKTPFKIVKTADKWFIGIAGERLTDLFETKEGALNELYDNMWNIIMHLTIVMIQKTADYKSQADQDRPE